MSFQRDHGLGNQLTKQNLTSGDSLNCAAPLVGAALVQLHLILITTHALTNQDTPFFAKWQLSKLQRHNSETTEWAKW